MPQQNLRLSKRPDRALAGQFRYASRRIAPDVIGPKTNAHLSRRSCVRQAPSRAQPKLYCPSERPYRYEQ